MDITYTKEDYITTTAPYEEVENCKTPFEKEQKIAQLSSHAKSVHVRNFMTLYRQYVKTMRMMGGREYVENASNFEGQELELNTGDWTADDYGITRPGRGENPPETACPHPIMPVLRLTNIDTGIQKIELKYKRGGVWYSCMCDRKQIASQNLIVDLANHGIAVTSENARYLVRFLHDVENLNYDRIPEKKSVSRLGWIGAEGFSPYVEGLIFDGENNFRSLFESVKEEGSYDRWLECAKAVRAASNAEPRIVLAASFASVLIEPLGGLPFFVHMWGDSESGKTVALMLATSVWANPEKGRYWQTFNSTPVAQELTAGFVNSLPLVLDELQILDDKKDFDRMIYQLAEGVGRSRGQKTGGLQKVGTWSNCILTTGEKPISSASSGGGAVNRVIELFCDNHKLFDDPGGLADKLKRNYGHAGQRFVEALGMPGVLDEAGKVQKAVYKNVNEAATEKQALAASMILTADYLAEKYIFHDGRCISYEDIRQFLSSKEEMSAERRAYEWIREWIAQNRSRFLSENNAFVQECFGRIDSDSVSIIRSVFNKACSENGFNPTAFARWLKRNGFSETDGDHKRTDKLRRINGSPCRCVVLLNEADDAPEGFETVQEEIEF